MFNLISIVRHAMCALALVLSGAAVAGPTYHVTLDTSTLAGTGFLDFSVVGTPGAPSAIALVSNLTGAFGLEADRVGAVAGAIPAGFTLTSGAGDNYLTQTVDFGGVFAFDIRFEGDYQSVQGLDGATFAIGLYDATFSNYALAATFAAQPASAVGEASLTPLALINGATITPASPVPEPSNLLLVLTGVVAVGAVLRRRSLVSARRLMPRSQQALAAI